MDSEQCLVCKSERIFSSGRKLSPLDLAGMQVRKRFLRKNVAADALHKFAVSMIVYDNPPGAQDKPIFFLCSECISKHFKEFSVAYCSYAIDQMTRVKALLENQNINGNLFK